MIPAAYAALPLLLAAGALIKKKPLCCIYCGVLIFIFLLIAGSAASPLYKSDGSAVFASPAPIGFSFAARQLFPLFPDPPVIAVIFSAVFAFGTMSLIYKTSVSPAVSALAAAACGALSTAACDPCFFSAMLICGFALRYASQRRFIRFAALVLLASCFSIDALMLIPLYLAFLFPAGLSLLLSGAAITAALLVTGAYGLFFRFAYGADNAPISGGPLSLMIVLGVLCAWSALMKKMLSGKGQTRERTDSTVILLFTAAFLSLLSVFDIRLLPLTMMCAFPALISLGGTLIKTTGKLIALTFKGGQRPVLIVCAALGLILLGVWYGTLISDNAAVLGISGGAA